MRAGRPAGRRRAHPPRRGLCRGSEGRSAGPEIVRAAGQGRCGRRERVRRFPQGQCAQDEGLRGAGEEHPGGRGRGAAALCRRGQGRAPAVHGADERRAVAGAAIFLLRRAPGGQDRRPSRRHQAARRQQGRGDRRRDHGRRHFDELPQCRNPGDHRRDEPGGARPRHRRDAQELRGQRGQGQVDRRAGRTGDGAAQPDPRFRRARRLRPDHRGGLREYGREEGNLRRASTRSPSRARSSPPTPPTSTSTRSRPRPAGRRTCSGCTSSRPPIS